MGDKEIVAAAVDVFVSGVREKYGCFPFQLDKNVLAEAVVLYIHGIEYALTDRYGLDTDD